MIEQGSPEWKAARCGRATASRMSDIMAKGKNGEPSRTRASYMAELVSERLTGVPYESFVSADMARGSEVEAEARFAYAFRTNENPQPAEFVEHPKIPMSGASPDALIGEDGLVEFKVPKTSTHIDNIMALKTGAKIDRAYELQVAWQLACTGRKWADLVSFDPRMPEHLKLVIRRVNRDEALIRECERAVVEFLSETAALVEKLKGMKL